MIIARAPMRISFVGGGTDLPDFYRQFPGQVLSTAIDKYVYVAVNRTPLIRKVSARYSITEMVDHPSELKNNRIRAALLDFGIHSNIEVGTFSHLPGNTGLGGSSSFAVALVKALRTSLGQKIDKREAAEGACRVELELLKEPIGKQDQYAAAFGGMNIFKFNSDESVHVEPVLLDFKKRLGLESHTLLFFTGQYQPPSSSLAGKLGDKEKSETLKAMAEAVPEFKNKLLAGNFKGLGEMLHAGWLGKKSLSPNVSNSNLDALYDAGMNAGAWGGKILGAGGGGCVLFLAPLEKKNSVRDALKKIAAGRNLAEFQEIPVSFVQAGVEIVSNSNFNSKAQII